MCLQASGTYYGRTPYGQRYSPLDQITTDNVANLQPAWTYQTGDVKRPDDVGETTYQVTPLKVGDTLYICTPHNWAIALDAATGKEKWQLRSQFGLNPDRQHQTCRGVSYYADPTIAAGQPCAERVYLPTSDARLIALDAANGQVCPSFADERHAASLKPACHTIPAGYYYSTSPPVIVGGKIIVGGAVNDNYSTEEPSGVIRAFDVNTGALVWNWDSGNPDVTTPLPEGQTYTNNSPNSWSISSADEKLGLLYVPLGNQTPDQLGMGRSDNVEKFSSSIVALDLNTGQVRWVRQTVHHDLWDMDVPAQPTLRRHHHAATVASCRRWSGRPSRATSMCSTGAPASRSSRSRKCRRRAARSRAIIPRRRSRISDLTFIATAADRQGHVGRLDVRPAGLPHRIRKACAMKAAIRRRRCRDR